MGKSSDSLIGMRGDYFIGRSILAKYIFTETS